jgi:proto-oncogene tyrosine-protein kinase ROS
LLENQGRGAWQAWNYSLEIVSGDNNTQMIQSIKGTTYTVDDLEPNTEYTIRVAAYTSAGTGQWSTEFKSKTLKSADKRLLLWSSMDGLFQSDIIGEHFQTLINKTQLEKGYISDVTWFEDILYVVSNSTLKIYNHNFTATKGMSAISLIGKIDSVESVAVDWIGKRLYWSNPTQQLITRSYLNGEQQEPLPILTLAKEIKIDALQGWIYYSTGHAVEACRLNGKDKHIYVQLQLYSGKQIMGLTLDIENHKLFWIVRSYEQSTLYSAPLADAKQKNRVYFEKQLKDSNLEGPLTHFSDRLLWLQNNETVIIGDMEAKYLAKIRTSELSALKSCLSLNHFQPGECDSGAN